jgi:hypothetical protein
MCSRIVQMSAVDSIDAEAEREMNVFTRNSLSLSQGYSSSCLKISVLSTPDIGSVAIVAVVRLGLVGRGGVAVGCRRVRLTRGPTCVLGS